MSSFERLEIFMQYRKDGVFTTGDLMRGKLMVSLKRGLKLLGIEVKFRGRGQAEWKEGEGSDQRCMYETEEYFNDSMVLFGKGPSGEAIAQECEYLGTGQNVFEFRYQLPTNIPPSFEGSHGFVRYWVKAKIHGPWGLLDQTGKVEFGIERPYDLNAVPGADEPVEDEDACIMCKSCFGGGGSVYATFRADRRGYIPGDTIVFNADISNGSDSPIESTKITFYQLTTYGYSPLDSNTSEKRKIAELSRGRLEPGEEDEWKNSKLPLPNPLPVSSLPGCPFIDIDYILELKTYSPDADVELRIPLVILIGNIPLKSVASKENTRRDLTNLYMEPMPVPIMRQPTALSAIMSVRAAPIVALAPMTTEMEDMFSENKLVRSDSALSMRRSKGNRFKLVRILSMVDEEIECQADVRVDTRTSYRSGDINNKIDSTSVQEEYEETVVEVEDSL
ncbi:hypothetical protein CHS0354_037240 [Potamilus streckersoni]|uniref:Arrestin C-terminal-like domain-containing protein n=1 Tax=Potamilus streckersoni TaxID=2493646 RepID=A0AAE0W3I3_9BIVA|nr:hypothetical protein CHS0354_037240 [Potamilus streckersoni]